MVVVNVFDIKQDTATSITIDGARCQCDIVEVSCDDDVFRVILFINIKIHKYALLAAQIHGVAISFLVLKDKYVDDLLKGSWMLKHLALFSKLAFVHKRELTGGVDVVQLNTKMKMDKTIKINILTRQIII